MRPAAGRLANEREQAAAGRRRAARSGRCRDRASVEDLSLDHGEFVTVRSSARACRAGLENALDVGGTTFGAVAGLPRERGHLVEEEGVPLGRLDDPGPRRRVELHAVEQPVDELGGVGVVERLEQQGRRIQLPARPPGSDIEQLGPGDAEQEDGSAARPVAYVLDEIEQRRLRPVQVVEDEHERARSSANRSSNARVASCVSAGDEPIASPGSTPSCKSTSTSGQYVMPSP